MIPGLRAESNWSSEYEKVVVLDSRVKLRRRCPPVIQRFYGTVQDQNVAR